MRLLRVRSSPASSPISSVAAVSCVLMAMVSTLAGCLAAPTTVRRTVNGIWSDTDLLVVESSYTTVTPNEPHYADTSAQDWEYVLSMWPEGDRSRSRELARVREDEFTAGGAIAYAPLYWDRDARVVAVGDWNEPYLITYSNTGWQRLPLEPPESLGLLMDIPAGARELAPADVVLSPSGEAVAVLWEFAYQPDLSSLELYHNYIMAFYLATDGSFSYARRLSARPPGDTSSPEFGPLPVDLTVVALAPYPVLMDQTQAPLWNRMIWSADGGGVYVVDTVSPAAAYLAWEPAALDPPAPVQPARVPVSAVPTASGPIGPDGTAAVIRATGNESTLVFVELQDWISFGDAATVPLGEANY